jgi:outer membrane murein-binding lipoprotein Lpp
MKNKLMIIGVITTAAVLAGCSNNMEQANRVSALTNQVNSLSAKVDMLESSDEMIKTDVETSVMNAQGTANAAASEAERANARIDNIVDSYKK